MQHRKEKQGQILNSTFSFRLVILFKKAFHLIKGLKFFRTKKSFSPLFLLRLSSRPLTPNFFSIHIYDRSQGPQLQQQQRVPYSKADLDCWGCHDPAVPEEQLPPRLFGTSLLDGKKTEEEEGLAAAAAACCSFSPRRKVHANNTQSYRVDHFWIGRLTKASFVF